MSKNNKKNVIKLILFERSFASNPKSQYWSKKNVFLPRDVFKSSHINFLFDCNICGHEFSMILHNITNGQKWCGYCKNKKLCDLDCDYCLEKSFQSNPRSICWSKKNDLLPRNVFKSSNNKKIFDCDICNHEFTTSLDSITNKNNWCPFCSNDKLCDDSNCKSCSEKSFKSSPRAVYWSKKNDLLPRDVFKSARNKYIFDCEICDHEFSIALNQITNGKQWCGFCTNQKLCDDSSCKICSDKSFESNSRAIFWSNKNTILPRYIFKSSHTKIIFDCEKKHEFTSLLSDVTNGSWCPICKNKTESKLYNWLLELYPTTKFQRKFPWSKVGKHYRIFDLYIKEYNVIIELDGRGHFVQVSNWQSPEENKINDELKNNMALENGINMIRICQEDVWNDRANWKYNLKSRIENLTNIPTVYKIGETT